MLYNFSRNFSYNIFNWQVRKIISTPPILSDNNSQVLIISQVCHRDIYMYLLAIKSLARFLKSCRIFVLDDTSLTANDKKLLNKEVSDITIVSVKEVVTGLCPSAGCWERLLFISDIVTTGYVIQMDCDTLTLREPEEVINCVKENRSFTQGTNMGKDVRPIEESCSIAKSILKDNLSSHVQVVAEANFDKLKEYAGMRYVRGCAGFAGFGKDSISRDEIEKFSRQMEDAIGRSKWHEWGSEQVTSNFVIANSSKSTVLPSPEYGYLGKDLDVGLCKFIHFLGSYRFNKGIYASLGQEIIKSLSQY